MLVFPGTNSEDETLRAVRAVGLEGELVHWSVPEALAHFDAFILPGGFAYEDRIRSGAVAAHDALIDPVIDAAQAGKFVLGICNGAQILAEAGLVPGTGPLRRPTAAFAPNASGRFDARHVYMKLAVAPERVPVLAGIAPGAVIPAWAAHGDGRLAAPADELARIERDGHCAFVYCDRDGNQVPAPNGSALECAATGEPRRQRAGRHAASRTGCVDVQSPRRIARCGARRYRGDAGAVGRDSAVRALRARGPRQFAAHEWRGTRVNASQSEAGALATRTFAVTLTIPDNEAFTAYETLGRLGIAVARVVRADIWLFDVEPDVGPLAATIASIETIHNPNKHRLTERASDRPRPGEVWIAPRDEARATVVAGRALPGVRGVRRRTSWRLLDDEGADVPSAELVRAIESFLCNPAFQVAMTA